MIVGCYSLDLYCRNEKLPIHYPQNGPSTPIGHHRSNEFPHCYTGQTERECKSDARKNGWRFTNNDAICPRCTRDKTK